MVWAERIQQALRFLVSVSGSAAPGEIGAALALPNRKRQSEVMDALRTGGLVEGPKGRVTLTRAGWARAGLAEHVGAGQVLDAAVAGWPYAHAAHQRLMASAMIARAHLAEVRPSGHLGFMQIGETGTGKSALAQQVAHLFGLGLAEVTYYLYRETAGSLLGRREQTGDGWHQAPCPATSGPLVLLDEFDKGEDGIRRAAWAFFQGDTRVSVEGAVCLLAPTPVLAAKPPKTGDRYKLLKPEYRRRCVVLDTGHMRGHADEIEELLTRYYERARPGDRLNLAALVPPADRLNEQGRAVLRPVRSLLTEDGAEEFPGLGALELAALGRLALLDSDDHELAAYATATDYLLVTETMPGQVHEAWRPDMEAVRRWIGNGGTAAQIGEAIEQSRAAVARAKHQGRRTVVARERQDVKLTAERAALAERLRLAADSIEGRRLRMLTDQQRADAAGVRAALVKVRTRVMDARSAARLAECAEVAREPLELAAGIDRQAEAEKRRRADKTRRAEQDKQHAARVAAHARKVDQHQRRQLRERLAGELDRVVTTAKPLEHLYGRTGTRSGEQPFRVLRDLRIEGRHLLTYEPPMIERGGGLLDKVSRAMSGPTPGTWRVAGLYDIGFPGTAYQCPALDQWGPNTRAVLSPVLRWLHDIEDERRAQLGRKPRTGRPEIPKRRSAVRTTGQAAVLGTRPAALPTGPAHRQDVLAPADRT